jgi:hypothetical protein
MRKVCIQQSANCNITYFRYAKPDATQEEIEIAAKVIMHKLCSSIPFIVHFNAFLDHFIILL